MSALDNSYFKIGNHLKLAIEITRISLTKTTEHEWKFDTSVFCFGLETVQYTKEDQILPCQI